MVQETLRWLGGLPTTKLPERITFWEIENVVGRLLDTRKLSAAPLELQQDSEVLIWADTENLEAVSSAHILQELMAPETVTSTLGGPQVLQHGQDLPGSAAVLIVLCTSGCMLRPHFPKMLEAAEGRNLPIYPVIG